MTDEQGPLPMGALPLTHSPERVRHEERVKPCPCQRCGRWIPPSSAMCAAHWSAIDDGLRQALLRAIACRLLYRDRDGRHRARVTAALEACVLAANDDAD